MKFVLVLTFGIIMVEIHLPANRLLLICKCRFWRFLKVDRVKSTFIDLLKKIDQIDQIDRIDQIDFYAVPILLHFLRPCKYEKIWRCFIHEMTFFKA